MPPTNTIEYEITENGVWFYCNGSPLMFDASDETMALIKKIEKRLTDERDKV